jgi:hypothetical protein
LLEGQLAALDLSNVRGRDIALEPGVRPDHQEGRRGVESILDAVVRVLELRVLIPYRHEVAAISCGDSIEALCREHIDLAALIGIGTARCTGDCEHEEESGRHHDRLDQASGWRWRGR